VLAAAGCSGPRVTESASASAPLVAFVTTAPPTTTVGPGRREGPTTAPAPTTSSLTLPPFTAKPGIPVGELPVDSPISVGTDNRVFLLGDSVMATLKPSDTNAAARDIVPLGWHVTIDAEVGRRPEQAIDVLRRRQSEISGGVAVLLIGNNYGGNQEIWGRQFQTMLDLLRDVPRIIVLTVEVYRTSQAAVNDEIYKAASLNPRVQVVDWDRVSRGTPGTNIADGLHLTPAGATLLATTIANALGPAPR
jgi:hypothetical protein